MGWVSPMAWVLIEPVIAWPSLQFLLHLYPCKSCSQDKFWVKMDVLTGLQDIVTSASIFQGAGSPSEDHPHRLPGPPAPYQASNLFQTCMPTHQFPFSLAALTSPSPHLTLPIFSPPSLPSSSLLLSTPSVYFISPSRWDPSIFPWALIQFICRLSSKIACGKGTLVLLRIAGNIKRLSVVEPPSVSFCWLHPGH